MPAWRRSGAKASGPNGSCAAASAWGSTSGAGRRSAPLCASCTTGADSALARIRAASLDWPRVLAGADWFHASGITPPWATGRPPASRTRSPARAPRNIPVSFDLNYREALWRDRDPRPLVEPLARQATVLIANPTAVRAMLGIEADETSLATPGAGAELAGTARGPLRGHAGRAHATRDPRAPPPRLERRTYVTIGCACWRYLRSGHMTRWAVRAEPAH